MDPQPLVFNRNNPVTVSVERVYGRPHGVRSAVAKTISPNGRVIVPHWTAGTENRHWNLWNRELLAYSSGLTDSFLEVGLRGPRLLETVEQPDGSFELLLEDVAGRTGGELTIQDHQRINRRLGQAQAITMVMPDNESEPGDQAAWTSLPWLSKNWIRQYASTRLNGPTVYSEESLWEHPVVVEGFGTDRHVIRQGFGGLYASANKWFNLLEVLPQTLCHLDFWPNNAIAVSDGTDVLIDWAFIGWGAVGEDPGNWIPDSVFDHFVEPEDIDTFESAVWGAYRMGLESHGLDRGTVELARLGMCASAVKYIWLPGMMVMNADHVGPTAYGSQEGYPLHVVFARRAPMLVRLLEWIEEAERSLVELRSDFPWLP
ncbi:MAG: phosphotransferase [Microthrixaceae bacterium]|nr:phosphotransferase [Microthrixaceae bacterium]